MTGIYVLANDRAKEWLIAWFESVRAKGCTLPVCIVPFDDQLDRVSEIAARYGATLMQSPSFPVLDRIGLSMTGVVRHGHFYRKLAVFEGPFEIFLYADSDLIALSDWTEILSRFELSKDDLWYNGLSSEPVYQAGASGSILKKGRPQSININTGFLLSRRNLLTLSKIEALAERTIPVRDQFVDPGDQGFVNYWIDQSGLCVESVADVFPDVHSWNWAGGAYYDGRTDMFEIADRTGVFEGKRFAMIHWAGFGVASYMPHRELFRKYRLAHASLSDRLYYGWAWTVRPVFGNALRRMRTRIGD